MIFMASPYGPCDRIFQASLKPALARSFIVLLLSVHLVTSLLDPQLDEPAQPKSRDVPPVPEPVVLVLVVRHVPVGSEDHGVVPLGKLREQVVCGNE